MKSFLKKILFFTAPLLIGLVILECLLRFLPNDYKFKKNFIDNNSEEIQTLILGNSHAFYGVNPEYLNKNSFNAAYVSQTLRYDLEIFRKYSNRLSKLENLVVAISYPSLFIDFKDTGENFRLKYYYIDYDFKSDIPLKYHFETTAMNLNSNLSNLRNYYLHQQDNLYSDTLGFGFEENSIEPSDFKLDGKKAAQRHTINTSDELQININYLEEIVSLAKKKKIKLFFVTLPTTGYYYKSIEDEQFDKTLKIITELENNNQNVFYYNFLKNDQFSLNDFRDSDHLNAKGAEKFTKLLNYIINSKK
ncbi:hypothetical protein [Leeuwenhoekiella sp. NPDC079379]|uniref:hypothetical protein n=1 Tax=Leeuwenhoekiella sp. NPDC079379 TaxID=3364122 RepID=UPI0037C55C4D